MAVTTGCCGAAGEDWSCDELGGCSITDLGDVDTTTTPPEPGQHLEWDGENWVPADPAPPEPLATGCGVIGDGTEADPVTANTSGSWGTGELDFPCEDTSGQEVYCDSAGQLRTVPEKFYIQEIAQEAGSQDLEPPPHEGRLEVYDLQLSVTNPSDCRAMMATFTLGTSALEFTMSPGNFWAMQWGFTATTDGSEPPFPDELNGGTLNSYRHSGQAAGAVTIGFSGYSTELPLAAYTGEATIPPGGTTRMRVRVSLGSTFTSMDPADEETPRWSRPNLMLTAQGWNI